jgi:hypothetical protein
MAAIVLQNHINRQNNSTTQILPRMSMSLSNGGYGN